MNISDAIAIGSVCVAVLSLAAAVYFGVKNIRLQQRLLELEQEREKAKYVQSLQAQIRAGLRETGPSSWRLVVANTGRGTARNVRARLDGVPLLEHDAIPGGEQEVMTIGPDSEISYCMAITRACRPPFEFDVTWDDDSGQQGRYGTTLTF